MPSTMSPSPGITSPAVTMHRSPICSSDDARSSVDPSAPRTLARSRTRVLRNVAACALPRPSAIASAKLANSTVNHKNSGDQPGEHVLIRGAGPEVADEEDRGQHDPTSTMNITGLRAMHSWVRACAARRPTRSRRSPGRRSPSSPRSAAAPSAGGGRVRRVPGSGALPSCGLTCPRSRGARRSGPSASAGKNVRPATITSTTPRTSSPNSRCASAACRSSSAPSAWRPANRRRRARGR